MLQETGVTKMGASGSRMRLPQVPPGAHWMLPRALATLGALLFAAGALLPWVAIGFTAVPGSPVLRNQIGAQEAFPYLAAMIDETRLRRIGGVLAWAWVAVFIAGILLCPLICQRLSGRAARLGSLVYTSWVVVATILATTAMNALARVVFFPRPVLAPVDYTVTFVEHQPLWGLAFTVLGLGFSWSAAGLLWRERIRSVPTGSLAPRSPLQLVGAAVTSTGVLVWALGFLALPWATVNCNSLIISLNHYVSGSCAALDAGDALTYADYGRSVSANALNGFLAVFAYGLLAGGALLVLAASWWHRMSRGLCIWISVWYVLALGAAAFALRGVPIILRASPILASGTEGTWVVGPGVFVAFAGLLLVGAGLSALWLHALGHAKNRGSGE